MSRYPTYVSPDGEHEQVAGTPARVVELQARGWTLKATPEPDPEPEPMRTADTTAEPVDEADAEPGSVRRSRRTT